MHLESKSIKATKKKKKGKKLEEFSSLHSRLSAFPWIVQEVTGREKSIGLGKAAGCTRAESQKNQSSQYLDFQGRSLSELLVIPLA